jgi:hypothetical protein
MENYKKDFGKKERILNFASNNYQLTRPAKVGAVMALIRECQPSSLEEWEAYYFEKAYTKTKNPVKVSEEDLIELGKRLYTKITEVVIPEWTSAFKTIALEDCINYIREVTIVRTYDGFLLEKSVINDNLAKRFSNVKFEESDSDLDHAGDIDYLGYVGNYAFGIQIKPVTANSNFGNYNISDRMQGNFEDFEEKYGGKVFIVFSMKGKNKKVIKNEKVIDEIESEIKRLQSLE